MKKLLSITICLMLCAAVVAPAQAATPDEKTAVGVVAGGMAFLPWAPIQAAGPLLGIVAAIGTAQYIGDLQAETEFLGKPIYFDADGVRADSGRTYAQLVYDGQRPALFQPAQ